MTSTNINPVFETTLDAMQWLQQQGYTEDLNLSHDCMLMGSSRIMPGDFTINHVFRFEGATDPGDEAILYGITAPMGKGILLNAYGPYADGLTDEMVKAFN